MKKRFHSVLLSIIITLCCAAPAFAQGDGFSDVSPEDWFAPYVDVCVEQGLLNGVGNGAFFPGGILNGDEALVMAARVLLKANGEAEFPEGPDAQGFWDWAGWYRGLRFGLGNSVAETQSYVDSWCWDPLFYLAQAAGPELFREGVVYPCSRYTFFKALAFATQGLDLEEINMVSSVPGTRDEDILRLYRAGILSGTDLYGTFSARQELTRAEAAAALARIAEPSLRLRFTLQEYPCRGYTLTPLMDVEGTMGDPYPVASILYYQEDHRQAIELLTLDGKLVDFPEGKIYSSGVDRSYDYVHFFAVDDSGVGAVWLMDQDGAFAPPSGKYGTLFATGDGHFLAADRWSDGELGHTSWYLLAPDGTVETELPETLATSDNNWYGFNEGVCPWMDEETRLWGYVDAWGNWVMEPAWAEAWAFEGGYAVLRNAQDQYGVIDRRGELVLPFQNKYISLPHSSPGHEARGLILWEDWETDAQGYFTPEGAVAFPDASPSRFYNGFAISRGDPGQYYLDPDLRRLTEPFDWCGDLTPDGQGFVGMDGKVYRIQFEK